METKNEGMNTGLIYKIMPKIMSEILPIGKDGKNVQQNYKFRGIDQIYNFVQPILAKNEVFMRCEIQDVQRSERPSKSGGIMTFVQIKVRYFIVASDGSSVWTDALGESMDSGDKAVPKALSVAQKYSLLQMFCIPTEDLKDVENDNPEPKYIAPEPKYTAPARPSDDFIADHASPSPEASTAKAKVLADKIKAEAEKRTVDYKSFKTWLFTIQKDWKVSDGNGGKRSIVLVGKKFGNLSLEEGRPEDLEAMLKTVGTKKDVFEAFIDHMSKDA